MNRQLGDLLEKEAPGILHWMIQGCVEWQRIGLSPPQSVIAATDKYLHEEDHIASWMDECCEFKENAWTKVGDLYTSWRRWAATAEVMACAKNVFSQYLDMRSDALKITKVRKRGGPGFNGISLIGGNKDG
jgi:putative DNA primase/helicase